MRAILLGWAVFVGTGIAAFQARANFIVTSTRTSATGVGVPAGYEAVKFFAFNDQTNGTGTQLRFLDVTLSINAVLSPNGKFFVNFQDVHGDGVADANVAGAGTFPASSPPGSYLRIGLTDTFVASILPAGALSDPGMTGSPTTIPLPSNNPEFQNLTALHLAGSNDVNPINATGGAGQGAQFAAAVVPAGSVVDASGSISGVTGLNNTFNTALPEPATFGVIVLASLSVLARRRRV